MARHGRENWDTGHLTWPMLTGPKICLGSVNCGAIGAQLGGRLIHLLVALGSMDDPAKVLGGLFVG